MRVLLVESTPGNAHEVNSWLTDAGHEVVRCFDTPVTFGCRGTVAHNDCPLESRADMALLVRDLAGHAHTLTEMGAVCAMRHRIPVVEVTEPHSRDLDATMLGALAAVQYRTEHADYEHAVRDALGRLPGLAHAERVQVVVTLQPDRVHAMLHVPDDLDGALVSTMVDHAGRALRAHDPHVRVIDVGVRR
ncbi:MAG: hypothetical protein RL219_1535 [Actinomycetota bacterium]|jgi:hypothetical protein